MDVAQRVLGLIEQIYEAAEDGNIWRTFLETLSDTLRGTSTTIIVHDVRGTAGGAGFAVRFDSAGHGERKEHHAPAERPSVGARNYRKLQPALPGIRDGWHPHDLGNVLRCNHCDRRTEIVLGSTGSLLIEDAVSYAILIRRQGGEPFATDDLKLLHELMPHIERALSIHRRTVRLELQCTTTTQALNLLEVGYILTDARGGVLSANEAAQLVVDAGDGLSIGPQGLAAATPGETRALHALIAKAANTNPDERLAYGALALSRPSLKLPLNVLVMPLRHENRRLAAPPPPVVAVFVSDRSRRVETDQQALRRWYGLTASEAELASKMAAGRTIQETATELAISWNTARWHLKNVYAKTSTAGQGQLMRLLLMSPAPLGRRAESRLVARRLRPLARAASRKLRRTS